jgi:hypothetical protein
VVDVAMPWPRWDSANASEPIFIRCPGDSKVIELSPRALIRTCERAHRWLDPAAREAWSNFWLLAEYCAVNQHQIRCGDVRRPLDAIGFLDGSYPELRRWSLLRDRVRELDDDCVLWISRVR